MPSTPGLSSARWLLPPWDSFGAQEPRSKAAYATVKSQILINAWSKFQHVTNAQASEAPLLQPATAFGDNYKAQNVGWYNFLVGHITVESAGSCATKFWDGIFIIRWNIMSVQVQNYQTHACVYQKSLTSLMIEKT